MSTLRRRYAILGIAGALVLSLIAPEAASATPAAPRFGGLVEYLAKTMLGGAGYGVLKPSFEKAVAPRRALGRRARRSASRMKILGGTSRISPLADIPGSPLAASPVSGSLDATTNADDVYSIDLVAGERIVVSLTGDAGTAFFPYLFGPGTTSVLTDPAVMGSENGSYPEEYSYTVPQGKGGTYYVDVFAANGAGNYSFTYSTGTGAANDQIPGVALPASPVAASLTRLTDADDVYAVHLNAGQQINVSLTGAAGTQFAAYLYGTGAVDVFNDEPVSHSTGSTYPQKFSYTVPTGKSGMYYVDAYAYRGSGNYSLTYSIVTPALKINYVKYTGPIAYDLKSLKTTRFYTSVDPGGVWAELIVKTMRGNVVIYRGAINEVNKNHFFPLWSGMGPDGRRLPSSSYDWQLTITKGGKSAKATGKIIVSSICVQMSGTVSGATSTTLGNYKRHDAYLKRGNLNCYVGASTTAAQDEYLSVVDGPNGYAAGVCDRVFGAGSPLKFTVYANNGTEPKVNGIYRFSMLGRYDVHYSVTVIQ